jgi:hypothetical protein
MSSANLTRPSTSAALAGGYAPQPEWISLADAARILRWHPGAVKSIALARGVRVQVLPRARILYSRDDCEPLAAVG